MQREVCTVEGPVIGPILGKCLSKEVIVPTMLYRSET